MTAKRRWLAPLLLAATLTLTTAACGGLTSTATSGDTVNTSPTNASAAPAAPFEAFLASVSSATFQDYAGRPGVQVRDSSAFQQMREYILATYRATRVTRSITDADGAVFDCVQQPSATSSPAGACPPGSVPMRRITLSDLVRFPTLQQFFSKSPGGTGQLPLPPTPPSPSA